MRSQGSAHKGSQKDSLNDRSDGLRNSISEKEELADQVNALGDHANGHKNGNGLVS